MGIRLDFQDPVASCTYAVAALVISEMRPGKFALAVGRIDLIGADCAGRCADQIV